MTFTSVQEALDKKRGKVALRGWVYQLRQLKDKVFIVLRDSSNIIQCIANKKKAKLWKDANKLTIESSIEIEGTLREDKRAPTGYELDAGKLNIIQIAEKYPLQVRKQYLSPELLLDWRHLWLRDPKMQSILKIRSTVLEAIREYWRGKGFYEYHSPTLVSTQCESGATLFKVDYYGKPLYLAQTWQLHAEPGVLALEKIFTIQPAFRAEKSKTPRHLAEMWMAEMEIAWKDFNYLQDDVEALIKHIIKKVLDKNKKELEFLGRDIKKLQPTLKRKFPRLTYDEVLKLLEKKKNMKVAWGKDLRTIEEDKLSELYNVPIIVTHYPKKIKAFYMKEDKKNPKVVLGFDVIAPEHYGEIVGASQREENIEKLKKNLKERGEDPKKYEFYFDTRRYGSVPHGGYGLGVERVISWICGLDNIKDAIPFPRTMARWMP